MAVELPPLPKHVPMTPQQRERIKEDIAHMKAAVQTGRLQFTQHMKEQIRRQEAMLQDGTPPELTPEQRDVATTRVKTLNEEIKAGMPTEREMNKKVADTLDRHMEWEKANKEKVLERKKLLRMIDPENDLPNYANIEKIRPYERLDDARGNYRAGWDAAFGEKEG